MAVLAPMAIALNQSIGGFAVEALNPQFVVGVAGYRRYAHCSTTDRTVRDPVLSARVTPE
ncbi:hypothetical protein KUA11_10425 [Acetobacter estunensis]|nr:hypothetical protein [Acetobacter estunensis]